MARLKRVLLLLCTIVLGASAVMGQAGVRGSQQSTQPDPRSWQRYTVKGDDFSVTLPTLPAMITTKTYNQRSQKELRQRVLTTSVGSVVFYINVFENAKPKQSLQDFISEQNANSLYDLASEREVSINGITGKEYSSRSKNLPVTAQFFVTEKRLYRFAAAGSMPENPAIKQFFSSIALGKKTEGTKVSDGPGIPLDVDVGTIYVGKEVDTKAQLISKPEPTYTEKARRKETTGAVILKAVFSATGQVTNIHVAKGLRNGLTEKAIEAARRIKFIPAVKDGKPVSMWMQLEYHFHLY
ncbi:MAG TPA: energy transducer TonB [Pyrinomonadaceae bacterium]